MITLTQLAKNHCLTVPKMKALMIAHGVIDPQTRLPFSFLVDEGRAAIKTTDGGRYDSGPVTYAVYEKNIAKDWIEAPSEAMTLSYCANRYQAQSKLERHIVEICDIISGGIENPKQLLQHGFSVRGVRVYEESYFGDQHFAGGPVWAIMHTSEQNVKTYINMYLTETAHIRELAQANTKAKPYADTVVAICDWLGSRKH